ncbi:MAG: hypothetical protein QXP71_00135 [Desulfurococcaceae archaeon]|uniref:Uncharacterized protein n=1 Tax=Staphylothermus marinus TaxID=2280 RepID=A0A7C4H9K2_STAMA
MWNNNHEQVDKIRELEEKIDKIISVQNTLLEEIAILKSRSRIERREIRRIEYVLLSLIEELKTIQPVTQIDIDKLNQIVDKYLSRDKSVGET